MGDAAIGNVVVFSPWDVGHDGRRNVNGNGVDGEVMVLDWNYVAAKILLRPYLVLQDYGLDGTF